VQNIKRTVTIEPNNKAIIQNSSPHEEIRENSQVISGRKITKPIRDWKLLWRNKKQGEK